MSKCGKCGEGSSGKGGKPSAGSSISKYSGGGPSTGYAKDSPGRLYGFGAPASGLYASAMSRYATPGARKPMQPYWALRMPMDRYKAPKSATESDVFYGMDAFDRARRLSSNNIDDRRKPLQFKRPPAVEDEEEMKRRYRMQWQN